MSSSRGNNTGLLTTVAVGVTVAAAAGFCAGWLLANTKNKLPTAVVKQEARLCECGFDLTGKAAVQVKHHMEGRQHRVNLHRASGAVVLLTAKINEYRNAIASHVTENDVVLEVGCAEGLTTQRLAQRAKVAIGIDQQDFLINRGRARVGQEPEGGVEAADKDKSKAGPPKFKISSPIQAPKDKGWSNLHLYAADAFDKKALIEIVDKALGITPEETERMRLEAKRKQEASIAEQAGIDMEAMSKLSLAAKRDLRRKITGQREAAGGKMHAGKVNKIWLDVSGSRETRVVVDLIDKLEAMFEPELIVVKSDRLKNLVRRSYLPSSVIPGLTNEVTHQSVYVIN